MTAFKPQYISLLAALFVGLVVCGQDSIPARKLPLHPSWKLELGIMNDNWGGGFTQINDDARTFGSHVIFERNNRWGFTVAYSSLTDKSWADTNKKSRSDEMLFEAKYHLLKEKWGWLNLGLLGGFVLVDNLGGQQIQETTHQYFGVPSLAMPYSTLSGTFAHTGLLLQSEALAFSRGRDFFYAFEPSFKTTWTIDYQYLIDFRLPIGIYSYYGDKLCFSFFYKHNQSFTGQQLFEYVAQKESGPGLGFSRYGGGFRLFWDAYLQQDYSYGGLAFFFQENVKRKDFKRSDIGLEFGSFTNALGVYSKYHWNKTSLAPDHFRFAIEHFYWTFLRRDLEDYPDVHGHYTQLGFGGLAYLFKARPKFQVNPKVGLFMGYKREHYYAGRDLSRSALLVHGAMIHSEIGASVTFPLKFLASNTLYGMNVSYNYNLSLSEDVITLGGKNKTIFPSYDWLSIGFMLNLDL